jgi:hypothetical protein
MMEQKTKKKKRFAHHACSLLYILPTAPFEKIKKTKRAVGRVPSKITETQ